MDELFRDKDYKITTLADLENILRAQKACKLSIGLLPDTEEKMDALWRRQFPERYVKGENV